MGVYSTLWNKIAAFRSYFKKSLSDLDLDNNKGKCFSIYNTVFKPNTIKVYIFSTLTIYTKA